MKLTERKREDLIGLEGTVTRHIEVIDAKECELGVSIYVWDSMSGHYWTELDDNVSLND